MKGGAFIQSFAILAGLLIQLSAQATENPYPWTAYLGSQDSFAPWGKSIRGLGRVLVGNDFSTGNAEAILESQQWADFEKSLSAALLQHDVIIPVGGVGSGRDQDELNTFMRMMENDLGAHWKEVVRSQIGRLNSLNRSEHIYWQVGNEINSRHYSQTMRKRAGDLGLARPDDPFIIPNYVEYFLAPTVEALRSVGKDTGKIPNVLLGTIAGARRGSSQSWMMALLDYQVVGKFAPSLKGLRVADLVDVVGIHYLVTSLSSDWRDKLTALDAQVVGKGRVRAMWATEELGMQNALAGKGAATALRVTARYLSWWGEKGYAPSRSRTFFWGWRKGESGTRGADSMEKLYGFLGDVPLAEIRGGITVPASSVSDSYLFKSVADPSKSVAILVNGDLFSRSVHDIRVGGVHGGNVEAKGFVYSAAGYHEIPVLAKKSADGHSLSLSMAVELPPGDALLISLQDEVDKY